MKYCKWCNKKFDNGLRMAGHQTWCKKNPKINEYKLKIIKSNKKRTHSEATKKKISESRLKYLKENPDKVPYKINHSSKMSYPEKVFFNALLDSNISGWIYRYQNSIYEYDFAWPELKIDVEIDGSTHNQPKVIKIDKRRDKFSKEQGWIVIRFSAKDIKINVIKCIEKLQKKIKCVIGVNGSTRDFQSFGLGSNPG